MNRKPVNPNTAKEFFYLLKSIEKITKNQARVSSYNPDDITSFMVEICPIKGIYQHAKFVFQVQLMLYPREFPNVICLSEIYHPNIEYGEDYHNVCLNLFDNWNKSFGLIDVIQGLIFLLYQPNLTDPISSFFNSKNTTEEIFRKNVHTSLHGGIIDGIQFLPNPGIIEHNDIITKRAFMDSRITTIDNTNCIEINTVNNNDVDENVELINGDDKNMGNEIDNDAEDSNKECDLANMMRNNNAAEMLTDERNERFDIINSDFEVDSDENLPTRDIISANALYSDLICSRYTQPDKLSESAGSDINDIFHPSIVFEFLGYSSASYVSAESDLCDAFDSYNDGADDWNDNEGEENDRYDRFMRMDKFITLSDNTDDPSNIFLTKWIQIRLEKNLSWRCPEPMTCIVLTNALSPWRYIVGIFYLCDTHNYNHSRGFSSQCVYRVTNTDRTLHYMTWLYNLCRWSMRRQLHSSFSDCSCEQLMSYSLFVGLSFSIHNRLRHLYNYGSDRYKCYFVK